MKGAPPQKPVPIPEHLDHGSSYVYRHYRCRCRRCQAWRREYDQSRNLISRRGYRQGSPALRTRAPWYVCAWEGERYRSHHYLGDQCVRCDAKQELEEIWERKWRGDLK